MKINIVDYELKVIFRFHFSAFNGFIFFEKYEEKTYFEILFTLFFIAFSVYICANDLMQKGEV